MHSKVLDVSATIGILNCLAVETSSRIDRMKPQNLEKREQVGSNILSQTLSIG